MISRNVKASLTPYGYARRKRKVNETIDKLLAGAALALSAGVAIELGRTFLTLAG